MADSNADATATTTTTPTLRLGVLALQGAFREHLQALRDVVDDKTAVVVAVISAPDLENLDGIILPGGESTTMGLIAERTGLLEGLRQFVRQRPVFVRL